MPRRLTIAESLNRLITENFRVLNESFDEGMGGYEDDDSMDYDGMSDDMGEEAMLDGMDEEDDMYEEGDMYEEDDDMDYNDDEYSDETSMGGDFEDDGMMDEPEDDYATGGMEGCGSPHRRMMGESVSGRLSRMFGAVNEGSTGNRSLQQGRPNPKASDIFMAQSLGNPDIMDIDNTESEDAEAAKQDDEQKSKERFFEALDLGLEEARRIRRAAHFVGGKRVAGGAGKTLTSSERARINRKYRPAERARAAKKAWRTGKSSRLRQMARTKKRNVGLGVTSRGLKTGRSSVR